MQAAIIRYGAIVIAFLLLAGYGLWQRGSKESAYRALDTAQVEARGLRSELIAAHEVIETERQYAQRLQAIATKYEGDKNAIERQAAADLASLRDGTIRLRQQWQGCEDRSAQTGGTPSEPDGGADLRQAGAVDLVRIGDECDAQIKGFHHLVTLIGLPAMSVPSPLSCSSSSSSLPINWLIRRSFCSIA